MYSYEDRIRAVELYIKLGRRLRETIRQLGYPTKNALIKWYREYDRHKDLPQRYVRTKPKYSSEQKAAAVAHYVSHNRNIAETMRVLGYPSRDLLTAWIGELAPDSRKRIVGKPRGILQTHAFKQAAVVEFCTRRGSARAIAQKAGVRRETLYNWKNQLLGHEAPASMKRHKDSRSIVDRAALVGEIELLQKKVHQLRLEHEILQKANDLLKKDLGIDRKLLTNKEKTQLVDALRHAYALPELLAELGLARSSYFYHRARMQIADKYSDVRCSIRDIFELNQRRYGYRRIWATLRKLEICLSEKVVRRLMQQGDLNALQARRRRYGSYLGEISPAPENVIDRDFHAAAPNQKWLTDITEFQIPAGKVYLSPVIDCFDGLVISWSIGTRPDAELVNSMLDAAIQTIADTTEKPVVHSDRGAHYRWPGWLSRMNDAKLTRSMSRKGCSPDNAACEGFFGRLKTEMFYLQDWQETTIDQFMGVIDTYIRWYNEKRIKMSLGALSPIEYRASLGLAA